MKSKKIRSLFLCGGADTVARRVRQQNIGLLRPDDHRRDHRY
ncbi:MAG: hypothetical protein ACLRSD_04250 [Oscillibacter sp.]